MNITEICKQALSSLAANKLRSWLTLLAIVVGVFAIISSRTAVMVLDTYFKETLTLMGGNVLNITRFPSIRVGGDDWEKYRMRQEISFETMEKLQERLGGVAAISPNERFATTSVSFQSEETEPNVAIEGSNQYYLANNAYNIDIGRNFTAEEVHNGRPVAIIGMDVQDALFEVAYPVGKTIRIDGQPYRVVGVTEERGNIFGSSLDNLDRKSVV